MTNGLCKFCGEPVGGSTQGRPRLYCAPSCERASRTEIKRIEMRMGALEAELTEAESAPLNQLCAMDLYCQSRAAGVASLQAQLGACRRRLATLI